MFIYELGQKGKDKITGFEGILTSRVEFLTGCNRYSIQPTILNNGMPYEAIYIDESQIEILGKGILKEEVQGGAKGACAPNPRK